MTLSKSGFGLGPTSERYNAEFGVWNDVISTEFNIKSDDWLKGLKSSPIEQYLLDRNETTRTLGLIKHWLSELYEPEPINLLDDFVIDVALLGEPVDIEASPLGKAVIEALDSAQISWRFGTIPQPVDFIQLSQFKINELPADDKTRIELFHEASPGEAVLQYVRIHKNKRGQETLLCFAPELAANRPMHQITRWYVNNSETGRLEFDEVPMADLGKVMNMGEWSEGIVLPALFKKLVFLAEAGAKSITDEPGARGEAFAHLGENSLPKPVMFTETFEWVRSTWHLEQDKDLYEMQKYPHVANLGWVIKDREAQSLAKTFRVLHDGLVRVQYALCDGFDSGFMQNWAGSWDVNTLSGMLMVAPEQKTKVNGAGYWMPTLELGLQAAISRQKYDDFNDAYDNPSRRAEMEYLVHKGVSASSIAAINSYVFSYLLPEQDVVLAARILEIASLAEVQIESINALSNWGVTLYVGRDLDGAEEKFNQVLKSAERNSDGEAYFYLAAIARARNDLKLAREFDQKCTDVGGYGSPLFEQIDPVAEVKPLSLEDFEDDSPNGTLTKSSSGGLGATPETTESNRATFCIQCGHKFEGADENFCMECGAKRQ
jgi:hypothetical protein